jgi:hypothetical protein
LAKDCDVALTRHGASIDITKPPGKRVSGIFAALAEGERELIPEWTQTGLSSARARGRKGRSLLQEDTRKAMFGHGCHEETGNGGGPALHGAGRHPPNLVSAPRAGWAPTCGWTEA